MVNGLAMTFMETIGRKKDYTMDRKDVQYKKNSTTF